MLQKMRRLIMERKSFRVVSPVALVAVMVTFLSGVFMANATLSEAASHKKKTSDVSRTAVESTESRITQLRSALDITEDQEGLWSNLTQAMRENAKEMDALSKERAGKAKTMNAVEHMKFHNQLTEAQLAHQKRFLPPFEALYASLSDEQKTTTDTIFRTGKHGKHRIN
jgi:periplasmic protein CpxP/Spy